jgi:polyvinyl alcohol dehydrogenase (cytochrome)
MRGGGFTAVRLRDGIEQWATYIDPQTSMESHRGVSAALSLVPGVVFVCGLDGTLRAFSTCAAAKGGAIGFAGATIVNGMVYLTSGYIGFQRGQPGNLLPAFGPPTR